MASRRLGAPLIGLVALVGCVAPATSPTPGPAASTTGASPAATATASATPTAGPSAWVLRDTVVTLAGGAGTAGSANGTATAARFQSPQGVAVDAAGNLYVADTGNHALRKISAAGDVTTLAGTVGVAGTADGTGTAARFNTPQALAVDGSGNLYVADSGNHAIRKVTPAGAVTTLAGTAGTAGSADGTGAAARFNNPSGVVEDGSGNLYVADTFNYTLRKITSAGVVTTVAGTPGSYGSTDGTGAIARFFNPMGLALDGTGNLYVADMRGSTIRKMTPAGVVSTVAGTAGSNASTDGTGAAARFYNPRAVAVDGTGHLYVSDSGNHTLRMISPEGVVTTLAGTPGITDATNGKGIAAHFYVPCSLAVDGAGYLYVADSENHLIRKVQ